MDMLRKDPYRLLFPIALLNFFLGLMIWLPSLLGYAATFPLLEHMQLLMRGMMYCFIIGFLLTMLPRVWGAAFVGRTSLCLFAAAFLSFPVLLLLGQVIAFEAVVIGLLLLFTYECLFRMFPKQPNRFAFALAATIVITLFANIGFAAMRIGVAMPAWLVNWTQVLSLQGSVLLFIFSLSPFLIKKFQGGGPCCELQKHTRASNLLPIAIVAVFSLSYLLVGAWAVLGLVVRSCLLLVSFNEAINMWRWPSARPWFFKGIWISLWSIVIGHALPIFFPSHVIMWNHIMYIPGFLQLCLMIGARVVCGHAQRLERIEQDRFGVIGIIALLFISVLSRVAVDWAPATRVLHLLLAALFAIVALALWFMCYGRFLFVDKKEVKHV